MPSASSAWPHLRSTLGIPSTKIPLDGATFVSYVLPSLVFYFLAAALAIMPQTRTVRIALWPLVALLSLRAVLSVDLSFYDAGSAFNNTNLALLMVLITARSLDWTLSKGPLVRHLRPAYSTPSILMDSVDLALNFRGIGWDWSNYRSYIPRDSRPANRMAFTFYTFLAMIAHGWVAGAVHRTVLTLTPSGIGSIPDESTIFDETLPFPMRYLRAGIISVFTSAMIYSVMRMGYDLCTIVGVLVFGQDPAQWPPAFHAPWLATSLSDFWGRRWHQFFRHIFMLGGRALYPVLGRVGFIIGTFFGSVVWHYVSLITLEGRVKVWRMFVGFGMMGVGILVERAFHQLTGRRVGGLVGWFWTMGWLLVWGNVIVEGFIRGGMFSCPSPLDSGTPLGPLVERLAIDLDVWLHTISRGTETPL